MSQPFKCPVCEGVPMRTPGNFCCACKGTGIVWSEAGAKWFEFPERPLPDIIPPWLKGPWASMREERDALRRALEHQNRVTDQLVQDRANLQKFWIDKLDRYEAALTTIADNVNNHPSECSGLAPNCCDWQGEIAREALKEKTDAR